VTGASTDTRGQLRCRDPERAAKLFLGAIVATFHLLRLVTPTSQPLDDKEARAHVRAAVAMFLAKYGVSAVI
jgi:TetR/AcrR family transcriptional repressor of mexJK operon